MERIVKTVKLTDGHILKLISNPLYLQEDNIDLDRLMFIDYANLAAEIATISVIFAQISIIRTDLNREVRSAELDLKIFKSKTKKLYREEMTETKQKFTTEMPDDHLRAQPLYKIHNLKHIQALHNYETIDSLYWSVKNKADTLRGLNLPHEDFVDQLMNTSVKEMNLVSLNIVKPSIR